MDYGNTKTTRPALKVSDSSKCCSYNASVLMVLCVSLYLSVLVVPVYPTFFCVVFIYLRFCGTSLPGSCLCCVSIYMNVFAVPVFLTVVCGVF